MTASPSKHYSGHRKAAEEEDDPGTLGKGIWRWKRRQRVSGTVQVGKLDGGKWPAACTSAGATRHESKSYRSISQG